MDVMNYPLARELLEFDEGRRNKMYTDSVGVPTIGIGHSLNNPISDKAITQIFEDDLELAISDCKSVFPLFDIISDNRQAVLISVMFNLGKTRFRGFKNMITAVNQFDFHTAAAELLDSKAARDLPIRYNRLANILKG